MDNVFEEFMVAVPHRDEEFRDEVLRELVQEVEFLDNLGVLQNFYVLEHRAD